MVHGDSQSTGHIDDDLAAADERWMLRALALARDAADANEVPVGAVVVMDGEEIASGFNAPISTCDPSAHAEIVALRKAATRLGNYRLPGCELYATLEPCAMCAGAIVHARVRRVVFAASDPKWGAAGSVFNVLDSERLNHRVTVRAGVLEEDSVLQLRRFFAVRR